MLAALIVLAHLAGIAAGGVKIIGYANAPAHIAVDASLLYARNLSAFLALLIDKEKKLHIDTSDEIVKAALLTLDGAIVNPALMPSEPVPTLSNS